MTKSFRNTALSLALATVVFTPSVSAADEITLTFVDQPVSLTGEFAGFSANAYIIIYNGQELHVPAKLMTCVGRDCLNFQANADQITVADGES